MTSELLTISRPALPETTLGTGAEEESERAWLKPIHNPRRSALVAAACENLREAARRLELLNARVRELTDQAA